MSAPGKTHHVAGIGTSVLPIHVFCDLTKRPGELDDWVGETLRKQRLLRRAASCSKDLGQMNLLASLADGVLHVTCDVVCLAFCLVEFAFRLQLLSPVILPTVSFMAPFAFSAAPFTCSRSMVLLLLMIG